MPYKVPFGRVKKPRRVRRREDDVVSESEPVRDLRERLEELEKGRPVEPPPER